VELDQLEPGHTRDLVVGLEGNRLRTVTLDQRGDPGLLLIGDQESGKTATLRAIARQIVETNGDRAAKLVIVDYRRGMLGEFDGPNLLSYVGSGAQADFVVSEIVAAMQGRLPGPDVTPTQLRERSWWNGPELHVLVDDYELVATTSNPLAPLLPYLAQARAWCDRLVVGLNSDSSVRALKGEGRPVNDLESRALVLAGLSHVDLVAPFAEATPIALIENASRPDQTVHAGVLAALPALAAARGNGPALIVIGEICRDLATDEAALPIARRANG